MALHQIESRMLSYLGSKMTAQELSEKSGIPLSSVLSFSENLREKGLAKVTHQEERGIRLTEDGKRCLSVGLPEERVLSCAKQGKSALSLSPEEKSAGVNWAMKNGWVALKQGSFQLLNAPQGEYHLRLALRKVSDGEKISSDEEAVLLKRKLAQATVAKTLCLEPVSAALKSEGGRGEEINLLTREMLLSGSWKKSSFRKYDASAPVEIPPIAKRHMVSRLKRKIAGIFVEMGFEEMQGPEIQSSFWNFDALFQPQDHPARDLADTFYLKAASILPSDKAMVSRVKKVHEKSWGGSWLEENAEKTVLRTHTTAVSAAYLYRHCQGKTPKKYFSIGKVYRNEATDYKHLAEFFQVEGIVVFEKATFRDLLGCLKEFYRKLGFKKIRFQPSYFPYTEPSLEVSVYFEKKKQWLELGGAGIFRPEVSLPLCGRYPVLAWGLSLERPLMLLNDMDDIRDFYRSNVGWIRKQKIK